VAGQIHPFGCSRCLVHPACAQSPGARPDVTSLPRGIIRAAVRGARQAQRGARGEHLADAPRVLLAEAAPAGIVPERKCTPVGSSEPWPCRHADEQRGPTSSGDPPAQHCRRFGDSNLGHPRPLGIPRQQAMGAPFFKKPWAVGVSPRWATSQTPPVMSMRGRTNWALAD
jgi:hypothetical protein